MKKSIILAFAFLSLAACSSNKLKPEAEGIRLVTSEPVGCDYLGEVSGGKSSSFRGTASLEARARIDLKNKAAALGGNTIQLLSNVNSASMTNQKSVVYLGAVYRCRVNSLALK